jgi:hypothetical protein
VGQDAFRWLKPIAPSASRSATERLFRLRAAWRFAQWAANPATGFCSCSWRNIRRPRHRRARPPCAAPFERFQRMMKSIPILQGRGRQGGKGGWQARGRPHLLLRRSYPRRQGAARSSTPPMWARLRPSRQKNSLILGLLTGLLAVRVPVRELTVRERTFIAQLTVGLSRGNRHPKAARTKGPDILAPRRCAQKAAEPLRLPTATPPPATNARPQTMASRCSVRRRRES